MTRDRLRRVCLDVNGGCPFCHNIEETIDHLFKQRDLAKSVWLRTEINCPNPNTPNLS